MDGNKDVKNLKNIGKFANLKKTNKLHVGGKQKFLDLEIE